jgi:hypothetical protein
MRERRCVSLLPRTTLHSDSEHRTVELLQEEQPMAELLQGRQYEMQLLQEEQPMAEWTQGEQLRTKLLLR